MLKWGGFARKLYFDQEKITLIFMKNLKMKCEINIYLTKKLVGLLNHCLQSATVQMKMQGYFKMSLRR